MGGGVDLSGMALTEQHRAGRTVGETAPDERADDGLGVAFGKSRAKGASVVGHATDGLGVAEAGIGISEVPVGEIRRRGIFAEQQPVTER